MDRIVLHQFLISPFCNKTRRCLAHKQLRYEVVNYHGLRMAQARRLSPPGLLPVLDDGGERIQDSQRIAEHLDRHYPERPLYPQDPALRAQARIWEDWAGTSLYFYELHFRFVDPLARGRAIALLCEGRPAWEQSLLRLPVPAMTRLKLRQHGLGRLPASEIETRFLEILDDLERLLARRPCLVGEEVGIADHAVAGQLDELLRTSRMAEQIRQRPALSGWLGRLPGADRPALNR
jgi:glutathione S-transferase